MTLIHDGFLLENRTSEALYKKYAADMPIFDYHCHLKAEDFLNNDKYQNITKVWLAGDHYKWRLLRIAGVEEKYITGDGDDYEKFLLWADVVSRAVGNPIYHWTHMELKRYFGIDEVLNRRTAPGIWETCSRQLQEEAYGNSSLLKRANVKGICTIDDPTDDLSAHKELKNTGKCGFRVLPTFRPDQVFQVGTEDYVRWLEKLEIVSGLKIEGLEDLENALDNRCRYFIQQGCLSADQSLETPDFTFFNRDMAEAALVKARSGCRINDRELSAYRTEIMMILAKIYHGHGLVMQLHFGAVRNINETMFGKLGPDSGFDTMGESIPIRMIAPLFNKLSSSNQLPKTILFPSNGLDHEKLNAFSNCFPEEKNMGKVQTGAPWWFLDHKDGIETYLKSLSRQGILSVFVGMLTDSRSILSMARHEYFRRILCNLLGTWIESGEIHNDEVILGEIIRNLCYDNAVNYFHFNDK